MKLCDDYCVVACINCIHFEFHDYDDFDGYCRHPEGEYDFKLYEHCCDNFVCIHYKEE